MGQPTVDSTGTVTTTGYGKADYSREISAAIERSGYSLKYNQTLKLFFLTPTSLILPANPYSWVVNPIAASGNAHLIDASTGTAVPYTVAAGYTLTMLEKAWNFNRAVAIYFFIDGYVVACPGYGAQYAAHSINNVVPTSTAWLDPTGAISHTCDAIVYNLDGASTLEGGITLTMILEAVSTPPLPEKKTVRCHFCGTTQEVHYSVRTVKCQKCGQTFIVINERALRHSA